jgi:RNA polymerase sigma factor (sigma-70 family)
VEREHSGAGAAQRRRPTTDETFAAAVDLATRGSGSFKRFARRYSMCAADAEDAYQRGLEILLTKAPTVDRGELRAWLHTVIKHEALALRRQRERALAGGGAEPPEPHTELAPALDEEASGRERVRQTAEALAHLKQSEIQCLLLKALGYSYDEIALRTGYSWTKVNRSLTEGRRRFLERFGELSSGARCAHFQAVLSAVSDGEAKPGQEAQLRRHLISCGSCRAALRSYRAMPGRVAELLPPGVLLPLTQQAGWWSRLTDALGVSASERAGALAWKLQQGADAMGAGKAAAVVASTAALAGGTVVHEQRVHDHPAAPPAAKTAGKEARAAEVPAALRPQPVPVENPAAAGGDPQPVSDKGAAPDPAPAEEFAPTPAAAPAARATGTPAAGEFGASAASAGAGGGGEFGP